MIDQKIDTGGILLRQECRIEPTDTAGDVHDKLMAIGADLVVQTVEGLIMKDVETRVQRSFVQGSEVCTRRRSFPASSSTSTGTIPPGTCTISSAVSLRSRALSPSW
jgi:Methionyl-tRNA formyltransferase